MGKRDTTLRAFDHGRDVTHGHAVVEQVAAACLLHDVVEGLAGRVFGGTLTRWRREVMATSGLWDICG